MQKIGAEKRLEVHAYDSRGVRKNRLSQLRTSTYLIRFCLAIRQKTRLDVETLVAGPQDECTHPSRANEGEPRQWIIPKQWCLTRVPNYGRQ